MYARNERSLYGPRTFSNRIDQFMAHADPLLAGYNPGSLAGGSNNMSHG